MVGLHESLGELTGNIPARVSDALWNKVVWLVIVVINVLQGLDSQTNLVQKKAEVFTDLPFCR